LGVFFRPKGKFPASAYLKGRKSTVKMEALRTIEEAINKCFVRFR